jgi:hypothetical protein
LRTETPELVDQCHLLSCPSVVSKYLLAALAVSDDAVSG